MEYSTLVSYALSFVAVVKAGGFSSAAKTSNISKAQLSRHVKLLESILNVQLLQNSGRGVIVTEAGQEFYNQFLHIETQCVNAFELLMPDTQGLKGQLKITAPIDFGIQFLPPIIHQFSQKYPNINVTLTLSNINERIVEQQYDLAFRIANKLPDSSLKMRILIEFTRIFCASPDYLKNHKKIVHPSDLKEHLVITSVNHNTSNIKPQWLFHVDNKDFVYALDHSIQVDSLYAQLELIKLGTGVGRMPDYFISNELERSELFELFKEIPKPKSYVYLLYPDMTPLPKKIRLFIDFIKDSFKNNVS